ncbi:MAG: ParM/StbA family protein [Nitrospirota bacterium]
MQHKVVGIDVGYGYTKIITEAGNGMVIPLSFPSIVATYQGGEIEIDGLRQSDRQVVRVDGQMLLVGEAALKHGGRVLNGREKGWISTTAYKALMLRALSMAEANSLSLTIVTGLPVNFYRSDKDKLVNIVRELIKDYCLNLTVKVIPQPLGSFFSLLFDDSGNVKEPHMADQKIGVLDIGFYTTDLLTIDALEVAEKQIGSFENGVSTALEAIAKDIANIYEIRPDLHKTEEAVKKGFIKVFGSEKSIKEIAEQRLQELEQEIEAQAKTIWKSGVDLDRLLLTGGGAELLKPYLNLYQHATVIPEAQSANALGYYRYGRRAAQ